MEKKESEFFFSSLSFSSRPRPPKNQNSKLRTQNKNKLTLPVVERRVEQRAPSGVPGRGLDSDGLVDGDGAAELGVYFFFLAFFWKGAISSANER